MLAKYFSQHFSDPTGNPAGGTSCGKGFCIAWQNGPLGRGDDRKEPNGAFVETIIHAAMERIEFYQAGKFHCEENAEAIQHLHAALRALENRTSRRESEGSEGTHVV